LLWYHFKQSCHERINDVVTSTPPLWLDWHSIRRGKTSNLSPSHKHLRCTTCSKSIQLQSVILYFKQCGILNSTSLL
jgi:hypothetical protein